MKSLLLDNTEFEQRLREMLHEGMGWAIPVRTIVDTQTYTSADDLPEHERHNFFWTWWWSRWPKTTLEMFGPE